MAIVKAISIKEPWATMIAQGKKTIEVRSWRTKHRGRIILCASKNPKGNFAGHAFALANLVDVRPMKRSDKKMAGNFFRAGWFAWVLESVQTFEPFPIRGKLSLYEIDTVRKFSI